MHEIMFIHGMGNGVLRKETHRQLSRSKDKRRAHGQRAVRSENTRLALGRTGVFLGPGLSHARPMPSGLTPILGGYKGQLSF